MAGSGYEMILAFQRQSQDFCLGFEAGRIWERLQVEGDEFTTLIHVENTEMALRMAEAAGRTVKSRDLNEEWIDVTFGPQP